MDEGRIYVRVTGKGISKEELEIYFKSRKQSGGGEISSIEQINDEESIITFEDKEVAKNVALRTQTRTHTINGAQVEVSMVPFSEEDSELTSNQTSVVFIRGLSKNTTEDGLWNYLENTTRSGGGPVEELKITGNSARVKFQSSEDAGNVTLRKHSINGTQIEVSCHPFTEENSESRTSQSQAGVVVIRGLSKDTTDDGLCNYLENTRRSGGGPVEELKITGNLARVKFETAEDAGNVTLRTHSINGTQIEVSCHPLKEENSESRTNQSQAGVVFIRGLSEDTTEDGLYNYLENTRRSGGGPVKELKITGNSARVKFESAEDAGNVTLRKHSINGAQVEVSCHPFTEENSESQTIQSQAGVVFIRGLSEDTTEDGLCNYLENTRRSGGGPVKELKITGNSARVKFESAEDAGNVTLRKHSINGAQVEVSCHPFTEENSESQTIQSKAGVVFIRGLSKDTTEDGLCNYLENTRRSGGGPVKELKITGNSAQVKFESAEDAGNVTLRKHSINGAQVEVSCHPFTEENSESQTIQAQAGVVFIHGLSEDTTEDGLCNYLENTRRSGGGPVKELKITGNSARVKFESAEDAGNVTFRKHSINGAQVEVSCHPFTEENSESQTIQSQAGVVFIRGLSKDTTEDGLCNYLENTRRSGGGPVKELKITGNSARVKFESAEDAGNVTLRTHSINGTQIEVSCHPLKEENSESRTSQAQAGVVFIHGLSEDTTEDGLCNYLENTRRSGGGPVKELKITGNSARVKFESAEDAGNVTLRKHSINGVQFEVTCHPFTEENSESRSSQPQASVVFIRGLSKDTTKDGLCNYLENTRRSGGGPVEELKITGNSARVKFESSEDARNITLRTHRVNGALVEVSRNPFTEDSESQSNQASVVFIRGLSDNTTEDGLWNYLENTRRSGGGPVEELEITGNSARVKFESSEVAREVTLRTHTVNGVQVEMSSHPFTEENSQLSSSQSSVVFIRGLSEDTTEDGLWNYLENTRRSGGGPVEEVKVTGNTARVKFESAEDARNVTLRKHTINSAQVEVSYHPLANEEPELRFSVVFIRGLSKNTTEDGLWNYLENTRRSGGGPVKELKINGNSARVEFESSEVAKRVVEKDKHTLNGANLEVTKETSEKHKEAAKTIMVTCLAEKTTEDSLWNYFENERRSGGGAVESVNIQHDTGTAFVTFEDADVLKTVLQLRQHCLDGASLALQVGVPAAEQADQEDMEESRTIELNGLAPTTTEDSVRNFFENSRRSGGGDIDSVEFNPQERFAVITFMSAESARGVLNKENLTLDKAELTVTLRKPTKKLPVDTKTLFVKGLSEKTTRDGLESFMEVATGLEVSNIQFGEQGCALVVFKETYSYDTITQKVAKKPLDGNMLAVEQVPVCHCVEVTGLNRANTTEDALRYYFENPKSGGGEVSSVELNIEDGWALVYFENPDVVNDVVAKEHTLDRARLEVKYHNPVLGKPASLPDALELDKQIQVEGQVMQFIFERHKTDFAQLQDKHGVKVRWEDGSNNITVNNLGAKTSEDEFKDACKEIVSFVAAFQTYTMNVTAEAWQAVLEHLKQNESSLNDSMNVEYMDEQCKILLAGKRKDVDELRDELSDLEIEVRKQLALEASKITITVEEVPRQRLELLSDFDFHKKLEVKYENTNVDIFVDKCEVHIRGPSFVVEKVRADVWQAISSVKIVTLGMSQNATEVLKAKACQPFMKERFKAKNLQALVAFDVEEGETCPSTAAVMGMSSEVAQKASCLVKEMIVEESLVLEDGQVQMEKSEKWRLFRDELIENYILSIMFDRSSKKLQLAGKREDVSIALKSVRRFLNENTIISKVLELPMGCRRFLAKYREHKLRQIQEELNKNSTVITGIAECDKDGVIITGTSDGVEKGMKMIQDLASTVEKKKIPLNKPGMRKNLNRSKGKKLLALVESESKCVIEYFDPQKDISSIGVNEEGKRDAKKLKKDYECSFLTPEGKTIEVFKDNICDRNVDVIVNSANTNLKHNSTGVAKAILDAGGEAIQEECDRLFNEQGPILEGQVVATTAGKLPFKEVIHAVGPFWREEAVRQKSMGKTPKEERLLHYAVTNALEAAKHFRSIAFPAISTGAYEFPRDLCANIMVDATLKFFENNPGCRLSEIQFTSIDDAAVKAFVTEMTTRFGEDPNFRHSWKEKVASEVSGKVKRKSRKEKKANPSTPLAVSDNAPTKTQSNEMMSAEGLKVVVVPGDMTREEVDVIVNSTSSDLDLSRNASSKALSDAAGPTLQQECKTVGKVETGNIKVTSGGNLGCKHVFHTSCAAWDNGKGEQVLRDILQKSLMEAQKRNLLSIAIPAIGTGNLQFPRDRVAAISFDEVLTFSKNNLSSCVKEVHLVVYDQDLPAVQAFQTELQSRKGNSSHTETLATTVSGKKKSKTSRGSAAKKSQPDKTPDKDDDFYIVPEQLDLLKPEIEIGRVTVQAETGDLTKEVTDAIGTLSNRGLKYGFGVGKAIISAGGKEIQAECSSLGSQPPGSVAVTGAGKLKVRKIYHMVPEEKTVTMSSIKCCVVKCLKAADDDGMTSISFPVLGTGNLELDVQDAAKEMLAAIAKFAQVQPQSLHLIRIVIYQRHMFHDLRNAMQSCVSSADGGKSFFSKVANMFGFGSSAVYSPVSVKPEGQEVNSYLEIFAGTKQDIKKAEEEIQKDLADNCTKRVIEEDAISHLSEEQKSKIHNLQVTHDVSIMIEDYIGRISVRGDAEDVLDVATTILKILNEFIEEKHNRGIGELLCKNTQWYYQDDDEEDWLPYDPSVNFEIETAHKDGQKSVLFIIDDANCEIIFEDMRETCLVNGEERNVKRKEIEKGVPLPLNWCVQPKEVSGNEKEVHLVELDPTSNSSEYNKVAEGIRKTASISITKIERVQNPGLYKAYVVKKDQMEQKNGANEKLLFHGTAQGSCSSISKYGFNRSYCGKNVFQEQPPVHSATVYGNGVYFARDASYSTQLRYSPADANGDRYMYIARVLVGEYAAGRQGMITPPPRGSDATDAYDSVVNDTSDPSIFVVFYDNQCYPDYLVTFK